jgi:hypothetical protein
MKLFIVAIMILVAHSASYAADKGGGGMGEGAEKRINKTVVKPNVVKQARTWKDVPAADKRVILKGGK